MYVRMLTIVQVAAHEFGHAFGIFEGHSLCYGPVWNATIGHSTPCPFVDGHSNRKNDLMAPLSASLAAAAANLI